MSSFITQAPLRIKINKQKHRITVRNPLSKPSLVLSQVLSKNTLLRTISKPQFEVIITRFNEALDWTRGIEHLCTVYNKGSHLDFSGNVIEVPNYGLDLETTLRHIITNYSNLSDVTMICQGRLVDRKDQPMYPLAEYYTQCSINGVFGNTVDAGDPPSWRQFTSGQDDTFKAMNNRTLSAFRKEIVKISYKQNREQWVPGVWISVGRNSILNKSLEYYKELYDKCVFNRALRTEEIWYLERSMYTIFTSPIDV